MERTANFESLRLSETKLQRWETIMIMGSDQHILSFLAKGCQELLICILAKLTATQKKHKLSKHVPPLKQLYVIVDIVTNNTQYTTICTNLHPTGEFNSLHHWTFHSQKVPKSCFL